MANSFEPKFADLVRNYTSTTGTGNLVLGEPAPGFTSFTSALQPGDSFYYSVMSLDAPAESEVGRGTLEDDGTIARDPIGGVATNFSTGLKSVALVTAAEWFEDTANSTQFSVAAPGAVTRPLAVKAADVVSVRDFGAAGDGVSDDTAAFMAAFAHGCSTGDAIFVPSGTYRVWPVFEITADAISDRFVMFGEGASSQIKVLDGTITASDFFFLRFTTSTDIEVIEVRDLMVDHNARGSPDPVVATGDEWAFQHSHTFQIAPTAGTIKQVRFSNVVVKDPAADGFNCSGTGNSSVLSFVANNCAVIDRTRVRSDVCFATMPTSAVIDGFYGDVIELESVNPAPAAVRLHCSNCSVNRLDIHAHPDDWMNGSVEVHLHNVTAPTSAHFGGVMLRASNCLFGISTDASLSRWHVMQPASQLSDCILLHKYDSSSNTAGSLTLWTSSTYSWRANLRLVGCESRIDASGSITPTGAAIVGTPGVTPQDIGNANLEVLDHKFDPRFETSVTADRCGRVRLVDNQYGGKICAVRYQSGAAQATDLSVEGGDFRWVTGGSIGTAMAIVDQSSAIGYLRLTGDHVGVSTPWVSIAANLPSSVYNQLRSSRRMLMPAVPGTGILGDIVELESPAPGEVDSYRCTTPGPAATYKARTNVAA